jgi:hypothetical protein
MFTYLLHEIRQKVMQDFEFFLKNHGLLEYHLRRCSRVSLTAASVVDAVWGESWVLEYLWGLEWTAALELASL